MFRICCTRVERERFGSMVVSVHGKGESKLQSRRGISRRLVTGYPSRGIPLRGGLALPLSLSKVDNKSVRLTLHPIAQIPRTTDELLLRHPFISVIVFGSYYGRTERRAHGPKTERSLPTLPVLREGTYSVCVSSNFHSESGRYSNGDITAVSVVGNQPQISIHNITATAPRAYRIHRPEFLQLPAITKDPTAIIKLSLFHYYGTVNNERGSGYR